MATVAGFGEMLLRLKSPGAERLLQTPRLEATFGGAEFNVLAALSQWGVSARFVSCLPDGPLGDAAERELAAFGIDTQFVTRAPGRMGLYFLECGSGARAARVLYDRAASAFASSGSPGPDWRRALRGVDWLHLTGVTLALGDGPRRAAQAAAAQARSRGIPVSLDVNYRARLWETSPVPARAALRPVLACSDVVFAGAGDATACLGPAGTRARGRDAEDDFDDFAGRLLARHRSVRYVVGALRTAQSADVQALTVRCRERGGRDVSSRTYALHHPADRIGAGDALAAGMIYGLLRRWSRVRRVEFAAAAAALKHSIVGDAARLSVAEILEVAAGADAARVRR